MPLDPATAILASAGIGAAGNIFGGLLGKSGQQDANAANLQIARENREWQERMSNTANQRAARDLEAAGLNRILAMGKPASTPAGNVATMQNENAPLQQGAQQAANIAANTALQIAQAEKIRQETNTSSSQESLNMTTAELKQSQDALAQMQTNKTMEEMRNVIEMREGITFRNKEAKYAAEIKQLQVPGVKSESEFYEWLMSAEANEIAHAMGKAGPLVLAAIRAFFVTNRGKR